MNQLNTKPSNGLQSIFCLRRVKSWHATRHCYQALASFIKQFFCVCPLLTLSLACDAANFKFQPLLNISTEHENNLFREPEPSQTNESIYILEPGFQSKLKLGRQELVFNFAVERKKFKKLDYLNFTGVDTDLAWRWLYRPKWQGELAYKYQREQVDFTEQTSFEGDRHKLHQLISVTNHKLSPRTSLNLELRHQRLRYLIRDYYSTDKNRIYTGYQHTSRSGNYAKLGLSNIQTDYINPDDRAFSNLETGYKQAAIETDLSWNLSKKSQLKLHAAYIDREQDRLTGLDRNRLIGSANWNWLITNKLNFNAYYFNNIADSESISAPYRLERGLRLEANWKPRKKIKFTIRLEDKSFKFPAQPNARNDKIKNHWFSMTYQLRRYWSLGIKYDRQQRDSSDKNKTYHADQYGLFMNFNFR